MIRLSCRNFFPLGLTSNKKALAFVEKQVNFQLTVGLRLPSGMGFNPVWCNLKPKSIGNFRRSDIQLSVYRLFLILFLVNKMVRKNCCVENCSSKEGTYSVLSFFSIPKVNVRSKANSAVAIRTQQRRNKWLEVIDPLNRLNLSRVNFVCSKHFVSGNVATLIFSRNPLKL